MAKLLRLRRGTTTQHSTFTGAEGEVTVDTTKDTLVVHDNATAGGRPMLREDVSNLAAGAITSTHIADGTIVNADISASAGIAPSKITGTAITANDTGTVTSAMIADGAIVNADINASAAIAHTKLASITAGSVLMGNATAVPTATALTGDVTISSSGVTAISSGAVVDGDINASAAISLSKLATGALPTAITVASANIVDGTIVDGDINAAAAIAKTKISGTAITAADSGTVTSTMIADGTIVNADINASAAIAGTKISPDFGSQAISTTGSLTVSSANAATATPITCSNTIGGGDTRLRVTATANSGGDPFIVFDAGGTDMVVGLLWQGGAANLLRMGAGTSTTSVSGMEINGSGHCLPTANNSFDLGSTSQRWRNIYTNDLNLSNEGGTNDVDGTWGSWTIQEGEDDLFLLNRRNGKKYKFNLQEVN